MLKRIKYVGRSTGREIEHPPGRWIEVPNGGTVDLQTRLAESLAEQTEPWGIVEV